MASPLTPFFVTAFDKGLINNKKPFLLPDKAWATLENAVVYRERVLKRLGNRKLGRLQRDFEEINYFVSGASPWTFNILDITGFVSGANNANPGEITTPYPHGLTTGDHVIISDILGATGYNNVNFTITVIDSTHFTVGADATGFGAYSSGGLWISNRSLNATEPFAQIAPGSFEMTFGGITFTDNGNGTITGSSPGNSGIINYTSGDVTLTHTSAGQPTVLTYSYYPSLPVMGIHQIQTASINDETTIWFDEHYVYQWTGSAFAELLPGATWNSTDSDFFWVLNYRGANPQDRLFFVTNFVNDANNPMRYTNGVTWTTFAPLVTASSTMWSARLLVSYYGRLLAFNIWEGTTQGGSVNIPNRCRFSQLGDPTAADAFRSDLFGKGGFIDAPTTEQITGATFVKNTLIVDFEKSTWQLRYVGEYGLPFIWERVSSDFGSESTFSGVLFDNHRLVIGDTAITAGNAVGVERIDLDIPDRIFDFKNANNGVKRPWGVRDFQRELVFWNYTDAQSAKSDAIPLIFPNRVLVYNYRNNTYATFRDNVTAFGTYQASDNITWSSTNIFWDDEGITWDDVDTQSQFPSICSGNQQGYVHLYGYKTPDDASLFIETVTFNAASVELTIPNHNLSTGEIIYLSGLQFLQNGTFAPLTTTLNNQIYRVRVVSSSQLILSTWDFSTQTYAENFSYFFQTMDIPPVNVPAANTIYVGNGEVALFPKLNVRTKDINIFQNKGLQTKLSRIDFLMEPTPGSGMSVKLFINASPAAQANLALWNQAISTVLDPQFYVPASDYAWFRFYATLAAQYFNINMTYDDNLMNDLAVHQQGWTLYAITAWVKQGGRMAP